VRSRSLENEEAKARYRAVENTNLMGCNARKTNKHTATGTKLLLVKSPSEIPAPMSVYTDIASLFVCKFFFLS
jgi:hypothetical protein